ncbi:MAG: hypothetical protein ACK40D_02980, partial [Cyanobacteriota bacterium]
MARPRWHEALSQPRNRVWKGWERFVAFWAVLNLALVAVDLTYVPLRPFWLQRTLHPFPLAPWGVSVPLLPNITPWMDSLKGIEPHRDTESFALQFEKLDAAMQGHQAGSPLSPHQLQLLTRQVELSQTMIDTDPFQATLGSGTLETIKILLLQRATRHAGKAQVGDSSKKAVELLGCPPGGSHTTLGR